MDEPALRRRLDAIERRQRLAIGLLVGLYALGTAWLLVVELGVVSAWAVGVAAVALAVVATGVGIYRRRRASV